VKRLWSFAPLAALLALGAVFALILMRGGGERGFSSRAMLDTPAPAYALASLAGGAEVTPASFAGKPYVVNFFASWCVPCRAEHPLLMALGRSAPVLGIAYKDKPEDTQKLLTELGDPFAAVGLDPAGRAGIDFGLTGVPETYVISADGRILAHWGKALDAQAIEQVILPALKAGAAK
jgi:cytochrome c biogenesis protein CcmG/thiol:disulfide interchange protein DsbE